MRSVSATVATLTLVVMFAGCKDTSGPRSGPPAAVSAQTVLEQDGVFGQALLVPPRVVVTDSAGLPVEGATVTFTVSGPTPAPAPTSATTGADGTATLTSFVVPQTFGTVVITASVGTLAPVTFRVVSLAPEAGVLAFNAVDPAGDTLREAGTGLPRAIDVLGVRGDFKRDTLVLTVSFSAPVLPGSARAPNSVTGLIEIDLDDNAGTGPPAISNGFGTTATVGVERIIIFGADLPSVAITDGASIAALPVSFAGNTLVVRIPLARLAGDDGNFSLVGVLGTLDRPTDPFPNSGQTAVRRGTSALSLRASAGVTLPSAGSYNGRIWWLPAGWSSGRTGR